MRRIEPLDLVDVLVYLIVLAIFTQFFPAVISESFLTSLITAVLLKLVLEFAILGKTFLLTRIKTANLVRVRVLASICLFAVATGSKALILWLTDLVLGDTVYLGGFFSVTLLVITLMLARTGIRSLFESRRGSTQKNA